MEAGAGNLAYAATIIRRGEATGVRREPLQDLGIRVVMVAGDTLVTACAIARRVASAAAVQRPRRSTAWTAAGRSAMMSTRACFPSRDPTHPSPAGGRPCRRDDWRRVNDAPALRQVMSASPSPALPRWLALRAYRPRKGPLNYLLCLFQRLASNGPYETIILKGALVASFSN